MPHSTSSSKTAALFAVLAAALALWVLVSTIDIVRAGWVAIPISDDWDRWTTYVASHYSFSWFFREHIDHRLVVPKMLFAIDQMAFHGRGWFVLVCALCFQAVTGFMLWRLSGRTCRQDRTERLLLAAAIACCIFSAQQWMNFIFPFQVQFPMVYCFAATALFALWESAVGRTPSSGVPSGPDPLVASWFAASIVFAALATYSMANGILIWPIMLLAAVWLQMPRRWILTLAAGAILIAVSYFYNWHRYNLPTQVPASERLPRALMFWLGHLGSPVAPLALLREDLAFRIDCPAILGGLLAAALLVLFAMLWRRREQFSGARAMLVFYAVFLAGTSATISYGRSGGPPLEIYSSRYLTPSYLFWVSMLLASWPLLRRAPRAALYGVLCAAMLLGVAIHQHTVSTAIRYRANMERLAETAIVDDVTDPEAWLLVYDAPRLALGAIDYFRRNHATIFSEEWTRWPSLPLNRRFTIDRTPDACQGQFEPVTAVSSPLRPGWRTSGWAWDNKGGRSPRYIVLADNAGLVAGVALAGFPPPPALAALSTRYTATTWNGYVNGRPRSITAYVVEADERSLCAIGTQSLYNPGTEVPFKEVGDKLPDSTPEITGAWVPDGYYKGLGGPGAPPVDGRVFGSFPDAGTGSIRMGPFHLDGHTRIAIPVVTGPDNHNLSIVVRDAVSKEVLAQMAPPPIRTAWWAWYPELPAGREIAVEVFAEDKGSGWGQWLALGWPHTLR